MFIARKKRIQGMLLGLHVGDSLGATLEFQDPEYSLSHTEIIGGGGFNWQAGDPTDDTELMFILLRSLVKNKGFKLKDFSQSLIDWYKKGPRDVGMTTEKAIKKLIDGIMPHESGLKDENSQGNGSLMRCAPLAIYFAGSELLNKAQQQCQITHAHPHCIYFDQIFLKLLSRLLAGYEKEVGLDLLLKSIEKNKTALFEDFIKNYQAPWDELQTSGYVLHTLSSACWALANTNSFEEALVQIVNRGDDSDTVGAVTGALAGAYYGIDGIPKRWLEKIKLRKEIMDLIDEVNIDYVRSFRKYSILEEKGVEKYSFVEVDYYAVPTVRKKIGLLSNKTEAVTQIFLDGLFCTILLNLNPSIDYLKVLERNILVILSGLEHNSTKLSMKHPQILLSLKKTWSGDDLLCFEDGFKEYLNRYQKHFDGKVFQLLKTDGNLMRNDYSDYKIDSNLFELFHRLITNV